MSRTIEISDKAFATLTKRAESAGVTLEVFIDESLSDNSNSTTGKPLSKRNGSKKKNMPDEKWEAWETFIGALDSSKLDKTALKSLPLDKRIKRTFGDGVEGKLKRIGLKV